MSNPLSHVGQTPHPEVSAQVQQHCDQVQAQSQTPVESHSQGQTGGSAESAPPASGPWEPPATRLPQHPQQQQTDAAQRPDEQQRIRQQGETRAEDTSLPAPTDAD
ncbi:hypothetical protein ACS5PN_03540 [Roseateles sp. NT4]